MAKLKFVGAWFSGRRALAAVALISPLVGAGLASLASAADGVGVFAISPEFGVAPRVQQAMVRITIRRGTLVSRVDVPVAKPAGSSRDNNLADGQRPRTTDEDATDPTLRRGDIVATARGLRIYAGYETEKGAPKGFVSLARGRAMLGHHARAMTDLSNAIHRAPAMENAATSTESPGSRRGL